LVGFAQESADDRRNERARRDGEAMSTSVTPTTECRWCGKHHGPICPDVKAIEFNPDGTVRRVEFKTAVDYHQLPVSVPSPYPASPEWHYGTWWGAPRGVS
jgi:hypothetical protein